jgi:Domain of unknown function (DUF4351)
MVDYKEEKQFKVMTTPLDTPWKQILESYFPQFMEFFFPAAYSQIDWNRGFEFLDAELQQITLEADTGKRIVDKLVKVYLKDGKEQWIAAHIEIQNQKEDEFSERVFIYFARLRDKFRRKVASFAVLGDTDKEWRPQTFGEETLGCGVQFHFPIVKLVDWKKRNEELENSHNPFAMVVQAHLAAQATKDSKSQERRKKRKFLLMKIMYERGYEQQQIIDLFRFIDWVLMLPPELAKAFRNDLIAYEGEKNMPYITSIEKDGEARGEARGEAKGETKLVVRQLNRRFGLVSEETVAKIGKLPIDQLEKLGEDLLDFGSSQDLADWLQHSTNC